MEYMPRPDRDLCDGSGVIYDWSTKGDPCPECTGGNFSLAGKTNMTVYKVKSGGCPFVLLWIVTLGAVVVYGGYEFVSMLL